MVEIKIVKTKKDRKNFINFENKLYSECEFFVPTVYKKEKHLFNVKKNPDLMSNETTGYLAYQDGKVVGRVLCIFNRIEKDKRNIIRFSHLDFINDSEVSFALLDVVEKWARFLKSEKIIGTLTEEEFEAIEKEFKKVVEKHITDCFETAKSFNADVFNCYDYAYKFAYSETTNRFNNKEDFLKNVKLNVCVNIKQMDY